MLMQRLVVAAAGLAVASSVYAQNCQPEWDLTIGTPGAAGGYVQPMTVWNDGTGDKLYVGGSFTNMSGYNYLAAYDLAAGTWGGVGGPITDGGSFLTSFAKFNPGTGDKLIIGGANFGSVGGVAGTRHLAMWDGQDWHAMGTDFIWSDTIWALHVWDDGTGPKLYASGGFTQVGGTPMNRIAKWDGTNWAPLGGGITTASSNVFAMTNFDDGSGDALYAGGNFSQVDGQSILRIARWDGSAWSDVGGGITFISPAQGVTSLTVLDMGSGPGLYATGTQFSAGGMPHANAARWDGQTWTPIGQGMTGAIHRLVVLDEGNGPTLHAASAVAINDRFMRFNEAANWWESTGAVFSATIFGALKHDDRLYLGGSFTTLDQGQPSGAEPVGRILSRTICPSEDPCYANCDGSTVEPILNVDDFTCFINEFAAAQSLTHQEQLEHYANCDNSTVAPVLNVDDFTCFINAFAAGCP